MVSKNEAASRQPVTDCNRLGNVDKMREALDERTADEEAEEEIEEVTETISQPDRGARRNAETTEAKDPTHVDVLKG